MPFVVCAGPRAAPHLSAWMRGRSAAGSVFCEGIVFWEFGGDRRWIKRWISDLLAAAVTLVRWITTSHLWPHLPALCLTAEVCVWVCVCVCVGGCAGQLYSCDRMRLVDQWPNEHCISLGQWSERCSPATAARPRGFAPRAEGKTWFHLKSKRFHILLKFTEDKKRQVVEVLCSHLNNYPLRWLVWTKWIAA